VFPIYNGGDRSLVSNYRPVIFSAVSKPMELFMASYLKEILGMKVWMFECQHGFRPGFSCESQVVKISQDIADSI
jgi:hypothetical protein